MPHWDPALIAEICDPREIRVMEGLRNITNTSCQLLSALCLSFSTSHGMNSALIPPSQQKSKGSAVISPKIRAGGVAPAAWVFLSSQPCSRCCDYQPKSNALGCAAMALKFQPPDQHLCPSQPWSFLACSLFVHISSLSCDSGFRYLRIWSFLS